MKLAFSVSGDRPAGEVLTLAKTAEQQGYEEIWLTEDYCERGAFALAGAVAATTTRIKVGIGVVNPWTRHPVLVAMEQAALDEVAGGRTILGMGASNARWMGDWLGLPFDKPISRLREAVEIIRSTLAGRQVEHDGDGWRVHTRLAFTPKRPDVPIVLGAKGRRALQVAGEVADGVLLSILASPPYVCWAREQIGAPTHLAAYVAFACDHDRETARRRIRPAVARYLGLHGVHDITRVAGIDPELAHVFRTRFLDNQSAVTLVTDQLVDTLVAAGDTEDCTASFHRFAAAGLDTLVVRDDPDVADPAEMLAMARECWVHATQ